MKKAEMKRKVVSMRVAKKGKEEFASGSLSPKFLMKEIEVNKEGLLYVDLG